ncbi:MAG: AtpZ/AtpI family protein [Rhodoferax sp.]|uniref:AtpZ/AtpI family protein n=1 Tax=Rhodoferax sp. TaxID=50421 RepID=UPI003265FE65
MSEAPHNGDAPDKSAMAAQIDVKARRKLAARRRGTPGVWFGLGTMGLIGWSVAVPTLLGAALGSWLDARYPGTHSWTLALLVAGLVLGCFNAWRWVAKEERAMHAYAEKDTDADT